MADTTVSVRVPDEIKNLFNELSDSSEFKDKGDFFNRLLALYQTEKTKDKISTLSPAIEAVQTLTDRLLDVINGAGAIIATKDEKHTQELEEQRTSFEETRTVLQQRITFMEQERVENEERASALLADRETAEAKSIELQQQIKSLESTINDKTALVDEYKNKNDTLSSIISEYKEAAADNKRLNDNVNNLKQVNTELQKRIDEFEIERQRQADLFKVDQENLRKSLLLEKDTALLELKQVIQAKAEEQQSKHAAAISEYENKVKDLLNLLQTERDKPTRQSNEKPAVQPNRKSAKKMADTPSGENDENPTKE